MLEAKLARKMTRRAVVLAPLLPLAAVVAGCSPRSGDRPFPTALSGVQPLSSPTSTTERRVPSAVPIVTPADPRVTSTPFRVKVSEINSISEWNTLPAFVRIQLLELKRYPAGTDARKELVKAVAEEYCVQVRCKKTPDEVIEGVSFLNSESYLEEVIKDSEKILGRMLTEQEKKDAEEGAGLEITARDNKNIYINMDRIRKMIVTARQQSPEEAAKFQGRDLETIAVKSILFHAISHLNESEEIFNFDPLPLNLPGMEDITFNQLNSLGFMGIGTDGKPRYLFAAREALTERSAFIASKRAGDYFSFNPYYRESQKLVELLNEKAKVSDIDFLDYYSGGKSIKELLQRWGAITKTDSLQEQERRGLILLMNIGFRANDMINQGLAIERIEKIIGQRLSQ